MKRKSVASKISAIRVWTGFAILSGAAFHAEKWRLGVFEMFGAAAITVLIVFSFCIWTCVRRRSDQFDLRISYYWESVAVHIVGEPLPLALHQKRWPHKQDDCNVSQEDAIEENCDCLNCLKYGGWLNEYTVPQVLTTISFATLFVMVVICKQAPILRRAVSSAERRGT